MPHPLAFERPPASDAAARAACRSDHAERPETTLAGDVARALHMIAAHREYLDWPDWRCNPDPKRFRQHCREQLEFWTAELDRLRPAKREAA